MSTSDQDLHTWYPSALPPDVEAVVRTCAIEHSGGPVPVGWGRRRRRRPQRCYEAAGQHYHEADVLYTEGRALSRERWIPHAWLTRLDGQVIDLAWRVPGERYLGLSLPDEIVAEAQNRLGRYGPLLPVVIRELGWRTQQLARDEGLNDTRSS